jgi:hypothetical protein
MTNRANTLHGKEYWVRCPNCGDTQKNQTKAHLSINIETGAYKCLRCNWGGYLTPGQVLTLLGQMDGAFTFPEEDEEDAPAQGPVIHPGPGTPRPTLLERFHIFDKRDGKPWDGFQYRTPRGDLTGWLFKRKGQAVNWGARGYLFPGDHPGDRGTVVRVVEGPYDVLDPMDVAVGGLISPWKVFQDLTPHQLIFTPDGDVWESEKLYTPFLRGLDRVIKAGGLVGLEILPDGKDPDEVPPEDREFLDPKRCQMLTKTIVGVKGRDFLSQMTPEKVMSF